MTRVDTAFASITKPAHFTDPTHCDECAEMDALLRQHQRETVEPADLDSPGADPLNFSTAHGKAYYLPALMRFALEPDPENWRRLVNHLEGDGPGHALIEFCSVTQRAAVARFIAYLIDIRADEIDEAGETDRLLRCFDYWDVTSA
ncbi:hypothetical protein ACTSKR_01650 [Chitinibacteraceae bacterium HSL-7]